MLTGVAEYCCDLQDGRRVAKALVCQGCHWLSWLSLFGYNILELAQERHCKLYRGAVVGGALWYRDVVCILNRLVAVLQL